MSDDVLENALVAAQEPSDSSMRIDLLQKLSELVFDGRPFGPSSYLSALWEEGTIEDIKREIAKHTFAPSDHSDPGDEDDKGGHAFGPLPPPAWFGMPVIEAPVSNIKVSWRAAASSAGWVSPEDHNQRVTELLNANNALVERRRIAEQRQRDAEALIRSLRDFLSDPVRAVLLAEIDRIVSGT